MRTSHLIRKVLDNGMKLILKENHDSPVVSMQLFVKAGSIYEGKYLKTGISHFVEHVIDDGTTKRSRGEIDELVEYMGNISNAYIWRDHTKYYITTGRGDFDIALDLLSDYIQNATFPEEEVEIQRQVILSEFDADEDEPHKRLGDAYYETAYQQHPVRYPVGGYRKLFEKLTRGDVIDFYKHIYLPQNMVFVAVGDFEMNEALVKVISAFENFPRRSFSSSVPPEEPEQLATRRTQIHADVEFAYLIMGFHTVDVFHEDAHALDLIASILSSGESSRLPVIVKHQKRLAYSINAWSDTPNYNAGHFGVEAEFEPDNLEEARSVILEELYRFKTELVSPSELERAKVMETSEYLFAMQTAEEQASMLGLDELHTGDCNFSEKYLHKILSVSASDVMRAATKYFRSANLTVATLLPKGNKPASAESVLSNTPLPRESAVMVNASGSGKWKVEDLVLPSSRISVSSPAGTRNLLPLHPQEGGLLPKISSWNLGDNRREGAHDIQLVKLENGMSLLVKEIHSSPFVSIQTLFGGGVRVENERNNGICNFTANLLLKGTKHRKAHEIAEEVESIGGSIDAVGGMNSFICSINLLSQNVEKGLEILSDVIKHPVFDKIEIENQRREVIADIRASEDSSLSCAHKLFLETMFIKHPYRLLPLGTEESVSNLKRDDVVDFYHKYCVPHNMVLAVFGDIDSEEVINNTSEFFNDFQARQSDHSFLGCTPELLANGISEPPLAYTREVEKTKGSITQAVFFIGYASVHLFHSDVHAMQVLNSIMSGVDYPGGRLYNRLRNDQFVYLIHAYNQCGLDTGYFAIYAATTPDKLDTVVSVIDEEIARLQKIEVDAGELERGKRMCISNYQLNLQTAFDQALTTALDELHGLGYDYHCHYESHINAVTSNDVKRLANQYLQPDKRVISILKPETEG